MRKQTGKCNFRVDQEQAEEENLSVFEFQFANLVFFFFFGAGCTNRKNSLSDLRNNSPLSTHLQSFTGIENCGKHYEEAFWIVGRLQFFYFFFHCTQPNPVEITPQHMGLVCKVYVWRVHL